MCSIASSSERDALVKCAVKLRLIIYWQIMIGY